MRSSSVLLLAAALGCGGASGGGATAATTGPAADGAVETPARYRLQLDEESGGSLAMTLWLSPSDVPVAADLPDVVGREARRSQIEEVECDGAPLQRGSAGWVLPPGCGALRYRVAVDEVPPAGVDPGALLAVRDSGRGWWFLPGAALFLVPDGMEERPALDLRPPRGIATHHHLAETTLGLALPPRSQLGRVMIGLGSFHEQTTQDGRTRIRHLFDDEVEVDLPRLSMATAWLARVTGAEPPAELTVFWFGRDPEQEPPPGAAGLDAVSACYYRGEVPADAEPAVRFAPLVSLLEQHFAVLTSGRLPDWARDSLGRLYAIRALSQAGLLDEDGYGAWMRRSTPAEPPAQKLLDMSVGDRSSRAARMRVGVGFFGTLSVRLAAEGDGTGLDGVLPELLALIYGRDGRPPQRFLTVLRDAGADDVGEFTNAWLGWPGE